MKTSTTIVGGIRLYSLGPIVAMFAIGIQSTSPQLLAAESSRAPANADGDASELTLALDSSTVSFAVYQLRRQVPARVCVEGLDLDRKTGRVSLGDVFSEYAEIEKTRNLTANEQRRHDLARATRYEGRPLDSPVDIAEKRVTGTVSASSFEELLDKLTAPPLFSSYRWVKDKDTYVIYPRAGSVLEFPVTLTVNDTPIRDVMRQILRQQPPGAGLSYIRISGGPRSSFDMEGALVHKLVLDKVRAREALCRAVEAAGPGYSWELAGYAGGRMLAYLSIPILQKGTTIRDECRHRWSGHRLRLREVGENEGDGM